VSTLTDSGSDEGLSVVLPAVPESVGHARRAVEDLARQWGAGRHQSAEIALAVSEACTNVVVHAYRDMELGDLVVTVERGPAQLIVSVADDGRGMIPRADSPGLGLGLPTIAALTSRFEVRRGPRDRGTSLRMTFPLASGEAHSEGSEPGSGALDVDLI
jgi:anti-sigma regulatory factor (Ser/Thr protein kinase)